MHTEQKMEGIREEREIATSLQIMCQTERGAGRKEKRRERELNQYCFICSACKSWIMQDRRGRMSVEERKFQTRIGTVVLVLVCFEELILILSDTHTHTGHCVYPCLN